MDNTIKSGQTVKVHYLGTFDDGIEFDNSRKKGEPISVEIGKRQMIPGFENAILDMSVGETKQIKLSPEMAYGYPDTKRVMTVPKTSFPPNFEFAEGHMVQGKSEAGQMLMGVISKVENEQVIIDSNHPLAGKNLNFQITLVETQS